MHLAHDAEGEVLEVYGAEREVCILASRAGRIDRTWKKENMQINEETKGVIANGHFGTWHTAEISGKLTEPELALNGQSHAGIEETALCYAQAQIDEMGLRRKWNCLAQGFMVAVPGKGCTTTERILMLWCLTAAV